MVSGAHLAARTLREPLEQLGFRKRRGEIFTISLTDEVLGWLGLNYASRHRSPGQVAINPVVGVRHQVVERLIATLRGDEFHEYRPPTISTSIGYLMPAHRFVEWEFGGQHGEVARGDLIAAITNYAIPFMQSMVYLPAILKAINQGLSNYPEYHLPAALEVMGRRKEAIAAAARVLDELGGRQDAAAEQIRRFSAAFDSGIEGATDGLSH